MGRTMTTTYNERIRYGLIISILFGISLALIVLIAAISIPRFYSTEFVVTDSQIPSGHQLHYHIDIGAFELCQYITTNVIDQNGQSHIVTSSQCSHVSQNCMLAAPYMSNGQPMSERTFVPRWSCSKFNAFRSFFVIAIASTLVALIGVSLYLYISTRVAAANRRKFFFVLSSSMLVFSAQSLIVSWAVAASTIDDLDASRGPSFGLAVTGWVAEMVALITLTFYHRHDPMREVEAGIMTSRKINLAGKEATSQVETSTDASKGDIELQTYPTVSACQSCHEASKNEYLSDTDIEDMDLSLYDPGPEYQDV